MARISAPVLRRGLGVKRRGSMEKSTCPESGGRPRHRPHVASAFAPEGIHLGEFSRLSPQTAARHPRYRDNMVEVPEVAQDAARRNSE